MLLGSPCHETSIWPRAERIGYASFRALLLMSVLRWKTDLENYEVLPKLLL